MNEIVKYETSYGEVQLDAETVTKYLTRGNQPLTEKEIYLFLNLCKAQKLNPFLNEVYAIKFGGEFTMVVGYDTYKRRAEQNPNYRGKKSGIVVQRGDSIVLKEGACLYPGEALVGGWCRVYRAFADTVTEEYKEVSLQEYDKHISNWKTKPATMIEKVAVSQALRSAFPTDFSGLYTPEEMGVPMQDRTTGTAEERTVEMPLQKASMDELREMFGIAKEIYGEGAAEAIKRMMRNLGLATENSRDLTPEQVLNIEDMMMAEKEAGQ